MIYDFTKQQLDLLMAILPEINYKIELTLDEEDSILDEMGGIINIEISKNDDYSSPKAMLCESIIDVLTKHNMSINPFLRSPNYYETDQMAIIHHSNYIRWFEEARIDWLSQVGVSYNDMEIAGLATAVTGLACEYKNMVRFGCDVFIETRLSLLTGTRMTVNYTVTDAVSGMVCATGETRHCFVNKEGRPVSLKKHGAKFYEIMSKHAESNTFKKA